MRLKLRLSHKGLILVCVPLIFEFVFVGSLYWLLKQAEDEANRDSRARRVAQHGAILSKLPFDLIAALWGYNLTGMTQFVQRYRKALDQFPKEFNALHAVSKDDPKVEASIGRLEKLMQGSLSRLEESRMAWEEGRRADSVRLITEVKPFLNAFQVEVDKACEDALLVEKESPEIQAKTRLVTKQLLLVGIFFNVIIAVALSLYFTRGTTRRLGVLMDNTRRVAKREKLNPSVSGADEIADLDRVFHEMVDDLVRAENAKRELMSMVSHDLRSPLTSIQGGLVLVGRGVYGKLPEEAVKPIANAERNCLRLINLINTLLDLDKLEAGKMDIHPETVSLSSVFERSAEAVSYLSEKSEIAIELPDSDTTITADGERLIQVVVNLLGNAIKFSPKGSAITISKIETPQYVEVRITDRGRGIPETHRKAVFDRFQQVKDSDSREQGGTGLGLAICKAIVDAHGGTIGVDSEEGKGSTFWFRIPTRQQS